MTDAPDLTEVADKSLTVLGGMAPTVQIVALVALALVALAVIGALVYVKTRPADEESHDGMEAVLIQVITEFGAQVHALKDVVEEMRDTIKGCATCPFHPHAKRD